MSDQMTWWNPLSWQAPWFFVAAGLMVAALLRSHLTYALGRALGAGTARGRLGKLAESPRYEHAIGVLHRWGPIAITFGFLTVGFQSAVILAAGMTALPLRRFVPAAVVGSAIWGVLYATLGFVGLNVFLRAWEASPVLTVAVSLALLAVGLGWMVSRRRSARLRHEPLPQRGDVATGHR